uniref:XPG-I domain-containing protein n=1 Tax=Glossina brevipalpis TaxID=37001 RepID=A0A1A9WYJ5_9MUSC
MLSSTINAGMGMFYRTICLLENAIKPLYVFDGELSVSKSVELAKRAECREDAQKALEKFNRRLIKVTSNKEYANEAKKLLKLMRIPYVETPYETEAQRAALLKASKVYATAIEDMDALALVSGIFETRKISVKENSYTKLLKGFLIPCIAPAKNCDGTKVGFAVYSFRLCSPLFATKPKSCYSLTGDFQRNNNHH